MENVEITLSYIRKKYKGKKVIIDNLPDYGCWYMPANLEIEFEYSYLCDWNGEETAYNVIINLNPNLTIKQIGALHCRRYTGADATSSGYRSKRAEEDDYIQLDKKIATIVEA